MKNLNKILKNGTALLIAVTLGLFTAHATGSAEIGLATTGLAFAGSFVPVPAGALAMAINSVNITHLGGNNMAGTAGKVYYAKVSDLESWPAALTVDFTAADAFADLVTVPIDQPFVFKAGKCFHTLDCVMETGHITCKQIGTLKSPAFDINYENNFAENSADYLGMVAANATEDLVFIVPELNGKKRVIGFPLYPAQQVAADEDGGAKPQDGRKNMLTLNCKGPVPAPIYLAPVPLTPAD